MTAPTPSPLALAEILENGLTNPTLETDQAATCIRRLVEERDALDCLNKSTVAAAKVAMRDRDEARRERDEARGFADASAIGAESWKARAAKLEKALNRIIDFDLDGVNTDTVMRIQHIACDALAPSPQAEEPKCQHRVVAYSATTGSRCDDCGAKLDDEPKETKT